MPIVTNPANGTNKGDSIFDWNMAGVYYTWSKVIVGYSAGSDNIYDGGNGFPRPTVRDTGVHHPGGNTLCYTRPKYSKTQGGGAPWYTILSTITTFTSTQAS